jgi:hypothetical protein
MRRLVRYGLRRQYYVISGCAPVRLARLSLWSANVGLSSLDWWLCGASLCSPFSNFRSGMPETGSTCDGDRFAERVSRVTRDLGASVWTTL